MKRYSGKSEEEAVKLALDTLGCTKEDFTYAVVEEEKHLFGLGNKVVVEGYSKQEVKEFIFEYLGSYFNSLDLPVSIEIILENDGGYNVVLDTENNAIIIGRGGQTLRSMTMVLKSAVNSEFNSKLIHNRIKVIVDVNNYREDRYRKVKSMAMRIAKEVSRSHIDASLDPMPNDERKVIHQTLQDMPHISTDSLGEGRNRHIVIRYVEHKQSNKEEKDA